MKDVYGLENGSEEHLVDIDSLTKNLKIITSNYSPDKNFLMNIKTKLYGQHISNITK